MYVLNRVFITLLLLSSQQSLAFVTVGLDPDCDYDNIFPAYQDGDPEIRVTNQQLHANNFVMDTIKVFKGGYDSCQDAVNDVPGEENTRWSGLNAINNTVIELDANLPFLVTVVMERFDIFDGENTTAAGAGGIKVSGSSRLILRDSRVYDNLGQEGGGIHVSGVNASLVLENTLVENNAANGYGGGLFCTLGASITMDADSTSRLNTAVFNGGGIYADQLCQVTSYSGRFSLEDGSKGLVQNRAAKGGGIYLQTGARFESHGSQEFPARIYVNYATQHDEAGGGGLYLTGAGTRAVLTNTYIDSNASLFHGGAMVVANQAVLEMGQSPAGCRYNDLGYCSRIHGNGTDGAVASGGAGHLVNGGEAHITQTLISRNRSVLTAGLEVLEQAYLKLEGNVITHHSDNSGNQASTLMVVRGDPGFQSRIDFAYNTVADNNTDRIFVVNGLLHGQSLNVFNSIIWDQGDVFAVSGNDNAIQIDCSVVHESQSLQGNVGVILANDPLFTNTANDNYRLSLASDAIDLCDQFFYQAGHRDMDGFERGIDENSINNFLGPYDAGAYEYSADIIFSDSFD